MKNLQINFLIPWKLHFCTAHISVWIPQSHWLHCQFVWRAQILWILENTLVDVKTNLVNSWKFQNFPIGVVMLLPFRREGLLQLFVSMHEAVLRHGSAPSNRAVHGSGSFRALRVLHHCPRRSNIQRRNHHQRRGKRWFLLHYSWSASCQHVRIYFRIEVTSLYSRSFSILLQPSLSIHHVSLV